MSHDDARICDVLTSVRDAMVSQLVAADLGETAAATMWARRATDTLRAWLTGADLVRAVQLLLSDETRQIATRIGTGVALVTPQTGTAVTLRAAVNGHAGSRQPSAGACPAAPGARAPGTGPGAVPQRENGAHQ